ncbi:hypothetical protein B0H34DRAFT_821821 [Crassisporium funariophilum]|nr:hypothetical protein B0H34DRAFT_821821 [Crassisporium funariophilum]
MMFRASVCICMAPDRRANHSSGVKRAKGSMGGGGKSLTGAFAGKPIQNYVYGIRAWHVVHQIQWAPNNDKLNLMLKAADKLTPLKEQCNTDNPFELVVFACLVCLFYLALRVGEFTVQCLDTFNGAVHVSAQCLRLTTLHIPRTKSAPEGEEVYWSAQLGPSNPEAALDCHLQSNQPPETGHLLAYKYKCGHYPLTKTAFVQRLAILVRKAGLNLLQGHGICIGAMLKYLLRGVPFDHTLILAPYIQAKALRVYSNFVRITMPTTVC